MSVINIPWLFLSLTRFTFKIKKRKKEAADGTIPKGGSLAKFFPKKKGILLSTLKKGSFCTRNFILGILLCHAS